MNGGGGLGGEGGGGASVLSWMVFSSAIDGNQGKPSCTVVLKFRVSGSNLK